MSASSSNVLFFFGEATVSLYPSDENGAPILTAPVWLGACANKLTATERWLKKEVRPSGARYPKRRPLVAVYEVSIGRVWVLPRDTVADVLLTRQNYVLDILWREDADEAVGEAVWHRHTFYGVTVSERRLESNEVFDLGDTVQFEAENYVATSGTGTPPDVSGSTAYMVKWVNLFKGSLGSQDLYSYDPTTHNFTVAGVTTGRATLGYVADQTGYFQVLFSGAGTPAFKIISSVIHAGSLKVGAPTAADIPRVEFWVGTNRVLSVTSGKKVIAASFQAALLASAANQYQLYSASVLSAVLKGSGLQFAGTMAMDL